MLPQKRSICRKSRKTHRAGNAEGMCLSISRKAGQKQARPRLFRSVSCVLTRWLAYQSNGHGGQCHSLNRSVASVNPPPDPRMGQETETTRHVTSCDVPSSPISTEARYQQKVIVFKQIEFLDITGSEVLHPVGSSGAARKSPPANQSE